MRQEKLNDLLKALIEDQPAQKIVVPPAVEKAFNELAKAQRGEPEAAMRVIRSSNIANQTYGFEAEHIGDLIHRMSEHINHLHGGEHYVSGKIKRVSPLGWRYLPEVEGNIRSNLEYYADSEVKDGYWSSENPTFEGAVHELRRLGKQYADAHAKLPVYNKAQFNARGASVSLGLFEFGDASLYLSNLKRMLQDSDWEAEAMSYTLDDQGRLVQYTGE